MKKYFSYIFITIFLLGIFVVPQVTSAQSVGQKGTCVGGRGAESFRIPNMTRDQCNAEAQGRGTSATFIPDRDPGETAESKPAETVKGDSDSPGFWDGVFEVVFARIANTILSLASILTGLSAMVLNGIIYHTIVKAADNYANISSISTTWGVVRDISNMGFIFVLLYAAIKQIVGGGGDNKKLIVNIVVVAILINFSLFFTKFIIDIGNILALTLYDRIAPGATSALATDWATQRGLSNAFMQHLNLQSLYKASAGLGTTSIITMGVVGTIMLLIAAFSFFAVALMFIIRYVILILLLVLSPIAFVAYALPAGTGIDKYRKQWVDTLIGQTFFAPIYFLLIWVTLNLLGGITKSFGAASTNLADGTSGLGALSAVVDGTINSGAFVMLINYIMVIILLIASLTIAKDWASKGGSGIGKLVSSATGFAGGATLGTLGWAGRNSIGRASEALSNSQRLKEAASKDGFGGMGARLALATSRKTAGSSFDFRATKAGDATIGKDAGKAGGKGGFTEFKKKQAEKEAKFAGTLGPGDEITYIAEQNLKKAQDKERELRQNAEIYVDNNFKKPTALEKLERDASTAEAMSRNSTLSQSARQAAADRAVALRNNAKPIKEDYERRRRERIESEMAKSGVSETAQKAQQKVDDLKGYDDNRAKEIARERGENPNDGAVIARIKKEKTSAGERRKQAYADTVGSPSWTNLARIGGYNTAAAAQIRKGKSTKDKIFDAVKAASDEDKPQTTEQPPSTPPTTPTP